MHIPQKIQSSKFERDSGPRPNPSSFPESFVDSGDAAMYVKLRTSVTRDDGPQTLRCGGNLKRRSDDSSVQGIELFARSSSIEAQSGDELASVLLVAWFFEFLVKKR